MFKCFINKCIHANVLKSRGDEDSVANELTLKSQVH